MAALTVQQLHSPVNRLFHRHIIKSDAQNVDAHGITYL